MAELLDIDAAAVRARVSAKTIRRNVTRGRYVGSIRDSKTQKWLIPSTSIDRYHDIQPLGALVAPKPAQLVGPVLLTRHDAAVVLGISEYAVHQAIKRGELTAYPWGRNGARVVPLAEIRRLAGA